MEPPVAPPLLPSRCPCENFLYVFKAARRAARAATTAAYASAPARAPATAGQTPVGWREKQQNLGCQDVQRSYGHSTAGVQLVGSRSIIVRGEQNPSRGAYGVGFAADP